MAIDMNEEAAGKSRLDMVRDAVRDRIVTGEYLPGAGIPGEAELAREFGASRTTVHEALSELAEEGLLKRVQGRGTYVMRDLFAEASSRVMDFWDFVRAGGHEPSVKILERHIRPAGRLHAEIFGVSPDSDVYFLRRVDLVDGEPAAIESIFLPLDVLPGVETVDVENYSLTQSIKALGHPIQAYAQKLGITTLSIREARALGADADDFALTVETTCYDAAGDAVAYLWTTQLPTGEGYEFSY